jgi:hypothetical protein
VAVYLLVAPRAAALRRFALDLALAAVALGVVAAGTTRDPLPVGDQADHAVTIAGQGFSLLARALVPLAEPPGVVAAVLLAGIAGAAYLSRRADMRRWLVAAGIGALIAAAGWALFIPAPRWYEPLSPGTMNRMNVLAAAGIAVLVYALVRMAAGLVAGRRAPLVAAVALSAIGAGYVVQVLDDQRGWKRSADVQDEVLAAVRTGVPDPPAGATIYTFGAPSFVAPGIPSFSLQFDLRAAVQLEYGDGTLLAYPVRGNDVIRCGAGALRPDGGTYTAEHGAAYGEAWFVYVPERTAVRIDGPAECRLWARRLTAS